MRHEASIPLALLIAGGVAIAASHHVVTLDAQSRGQAAAPAFEVDRMWPKPLANHWILGSITGLSVDSQDHIWIVHRGMPSLTPGTEAGTGTTPPTAEDCCTPAPPVLEFDAAGTLVGHWGGPGQGFDWPVSPGGIEVDAKGNVWIAAAGAPEPLAAVPRAGGAGRAAGGAAAGGAGGDVITPAVAGRAAAAGTGAAAGGGGAAAAGGAAAGTGRGGGNRGGAAAPARPEDAHILKFSRTGAFVMQIGKAGKVGDKASEDALNRPVDMAVDTAANEVYVADGGTSQRIVVFDATTGAHKRHWSGHGTDFTRLSCIALSKDGLVYVCDRKNDRLQVFKKDGTFVAEAFVSKATLGNGSVWDVAFSNDAAQRYLFVADGQDEKIFVLDRTTLAVVSSFGDGGGWPGTFRGVGSVGMDSKGVLYTGESYEGKRIQKFIKK